MKKNGCNPHHWLIEEASEPAAKGICKNCGAGTVFVSSPVEVSPALNAKQREKHMKEVYANAPEN